MIMVKTVFWCSMPFDYLNYVTLCLLWDNWVFNEYHNENPPFFLVLDSNYLSLFLNWIMHACMQKICFNALTNECIEWLIMLILLIISASCLYSVDVLICACKMNDLFSISKEMALLVAFYLCTHDWFSMRLDCLKPHSPLHVYTFSLSCSFQ